MMQVTVNATGEHAQARYRRDRPGVALVVRREPEGPYLHEMQLGALTPVSGDDPAELLAAGDYFADLDDANPALRAAMWGLAVGYWSAGLTSAPSTL